ncbi:helicase carboxy-terminal domain [Brachionus plicatilis]|uniref:Helicase carboxy-terminal domain n=1 Tax=Brachionus plicatilis TaxID=10195 RepID=A0A3M7SQE0_BRAPC|nr:helicase carboxy-terminal domain [Brachionus plicatilis]
MTIVSRYLYHLQTPYANIYLSQRDYDEFKEMFELFELQKQIFYGTFNKNKDREQVLLIDEVDVFFNEDFLGNFYIPLAKLRHQSISQLLNKIWQERHQIDLEKLEEKVEFKECQRAFSNWMDLLNECFKDVLADLKTFESHQYKVTNDKISYMEHVSGTLKNLSQSQIDVIKKLYDISKFIYIPSIYGKGKLNFGNESDTIVTSKDDYFIRIREELDKRMNGTVNPETLSDFYKSPQMEGYVLDDRVNILNEDATTNGKITLLTRSFGHGIDFICNNKSILNNEDLEKFFGTSYKADLESLINNRSVYETTNQKRKDFFNIYTQTIQKSIDQALSDHEQSKEFQENLRNSKFNLVKSFLIKQNLGATMTKSRSKTMVLMNATGSMSHLLNQVKNTICTMFDRAIEILKEHEISSDSFEIQLATFEWEKKPLNLRNFMNNIKANDGVDYPEAIEIGLLHVNQEIKRFNSEDRVSQLLGVTIDNKLTFLQHINSKLSNSYYFCVQRLLNIRPNIHGNDDFSTLNIKLNKFNIDCFQHRIIKRLAHFVHKIVNLKTSPVDLKESNIKGEMLRIISSTQINK